MLSEKLSQSCLYPLVVYSTRTDGFLKMLEANRVLLQTWSKMVKNGPSGYLLNLRNLVTNFIFKEYPVIYFLGLSCSQGRRVPKDNTG